MQPFDLKKALAGKKVVTRDGRVVSGITHNVNARTYKVCAWIDRIPYTYTEEGVFDVGRKETSLLDLFMADNQKG